MAMTVRENRERVDLDQLLHPARAFGHPSEVVSEKRAILASWALDACAVEASPELREPLKGVRVSYDDVMDALKRLDGEAAKRADFGRLIDRARRIRDLYNKDGSGGVFIG
jgi:hypothetical protein